MYIRKIYFFLFFASSLACAIYVFGVRAELFSEFPFFHDNQTFTYPLRVFIEQHLVNFKFIFYDHYIPGGSVLNSIFLSAALSPIVWLISLLIGYTPLGFVCEIIGYFSLSVLGCYLWLRLKHASWIALFGAFAYSFILNNLYQSSMNVECLATVAFVPLFMFGLSKALRHQVSGISLTASALFLMFTSGYLGSNVLVVQLAIAFCMLEYLFVDGGFRAENRFQFLVYPFLSMVIFFGLYQFLLLETFSNYPSSKFLNRTIDPFTGVTGFYTLITLVFPANISPHIVGQWGVSDQWFLMYFGWTTLFFVIKAVCGSWRSHKWLLLSFAIMSFLLVLPEKNLFSRFFINWFPFFTKVRFHIWITYMCNLFMVNLACYGFEEYLSGSSRDRFFAIFIFSIVICISIYSRYFFQFPGLESSDFYPMLFLLCCIFTVSIKSHGLLEVRCIVVILLLLLEIFVVFQRKANRNMVVGFGDSYAVLRRAYFDSKEEEKMRHLDTKFRPLSNLRTKEAINTRHYIHRRIAYSGSYAPQIHPTIENIINKGLSDKLLERILYPSDISGLPDLSDPPIIQIKKYESNYVEFFVENLKERYFTWSTPFNENWILETNGERKESFANDYQLISFRAVEGNLVIKFRYNPFYLKYSLWIFFLSLMSLMLSAFYAFIRQFLFYWRLYFQKCTDRDIL